MPDVPEGITYRGPMGIARDSLWLTSEDLPHDRDVGVTIESVQRRDKVKFQQGREKPVTLALRFVGRERELLLNATHRKTLRLLYGEGSEVLFGKKILLFVEQNVRRPDGTSGPAVRIRAKRFDDTAPKGKGIADADAVPPEELPIS